MLVLAIETSCDETGIAIYGTLDQQPARLLANQLFSQVEMHRLFGGVVPELASRDHLKRLLPLVNQALEQAQVTLQQINAICYTAGPGLIGALMVGATFARSLAYSLDIPALAINHLEGHLLAPYLEENPPSFPFLGLLVSGGHSEIVAVKRLGDYQQLGRSLDDAVGEAFDKTANILGLGYPGGAALSKLAQSGKPDYKFTLPMVNRPGLEMSFSGLKTAALNRFNYDKQHAPDFEQAKADLAKAFEVAVVDTLIVKVTRALQQSNLKRLVIAGGVSANSYLREQLKAKLKNIEIFYARPIFCVDNGAMIAYAGYQRFVLTYIQQQPQFKIRARWPLEELRVPC